jgi:hypothetical protein
LGIAEAIVCPSASKAANLAPVRPLNRSRIAGVGGKFTGVSPPATLESRWRISRSARRIATQTHAPVARRVANNWIARSGTRI